MGNTQPSSGGGRGRREPHSGASDPSLIPFNYDFPELHLTRGTNLNEEEEEAKGADNPNADSAPSKTTTLKMFNSREFCNQRLVGEGAFGKVLEGFILGTRVAVKIFHAPLVMDEARCQIGPLMRLKHRNLVRILGILTDPSSSGMAAMECPQVLLDYFPEGNLLQFLSKPENPQDYAMLGKLALDIVHGCEYLHGRGIIHGNLAARNILVEKAIGKQRTHYNAKVGDFAISRFAKGSGGNFMTLPSGKVVPVRWVPPELVMEDKRGSDFSFASDVWSFGIVLWEMWAKGDIPYGVSSTNMQVLEFVRKGQSPLAIRTPKGCPTHIRGLMESIFKADPKNRPTFTMLNGAFENFKLKAREMAEEKAAKANAQQSDKNKSSPSDQAEAKKNENQGKKKGSKVEVTSGGNVDGAKAAPGQGKPKKPGNPGDPQAKKDGGKTPSTNKQKQGNEQKSANPPSNRGRGRGGHPKQEQRAGGPGPGPFPGNYPEGTANYPPPPPPYTPSPLPNHSAYVGSPVGGIGYGYPNQGPPLGPQSTFDDEIRKRQEEIKRLEAQKVSDEIQRKTAELTEAIQRGASLGISGAGGGVGLVGGPSVPFGSLAMPQPGPAPQVWVDKGERGRGGGGGRGRGKAKRGHVTS